MDPVKEFAIENDAELKQDFCASHNDFHKWFNEHYPGAMYEVDVGEDRAPDYECELESWEMEQARNEFVEEHNTEYWQYVGEQHADRLSRGE